MMHKVNVRIIKQTSLSENLTKVAQQTELKLASVDTVHKKCFLFNNAIDQWLKEFCWLFWLKAVILHQNSCLLSNWSHDTVKLSLMLAGDIL